MDENYVVGDNEKGKGKEAHLLEIDVRNGDLMGIKHCAHLNPIFYLGKYCKGATSMVSVDESGKVLVWSEEEFGAALLHSTPRVVRISDKIDFVKLMGGMLWTAGRTEMHAPGTPSRTPIIRVYDLFGSGSGIGIGHGSGAGKVAKAGVGKTVMPTEHVGPVTSATIVPVHPGHVYLGHEEGFITIWNVDGDGDDISPGGFDGGSSTPKCVQVMKVSSSDVTCLEGITDRLWAGARNGMITAYDILPRPWIATNSWTAHHNLPVLHLFADPYGISTPLNQLAVVSVGRDERVCLWDGLLGREWVDREVQKHEAGYSTFRDLKVLIVTWNCDSAKPDSLYGDPANINFFHDLLNSVEGKDPPDIISFGFQEVIDLESRKMAAKSMLMSAKNRNLKEEGMSSTAPMGMGMSTATGSATLLGLSEKVTGAYKRWFDALVIAVRIAMPPDCPYSVVHTESMVGLFTCVMVKNAERGSVRDVAINTVKRGMGGRYGNKVCRSFMNHCGTDLVCFRVGYSLDSSLMIRHYVLSTVTLLLGSIMFEPETQMRLVCLSSNSYSRRWSL